MSGNRHAANANTQFLYYDVGYTIRHHIIAFDMEEWKQTKTLTIDVPHQQVLHVNENGVYAWRHDEGRIFFTDWSGNSCPVSDFIPFTPIYTDYYAEEQDDSKNIWYAEAMNGKLMVFDVTDEVKLLAAVEV